MRIRFLHLFFFILAFSLTVRGFPCSHTPTWDELRQGITKGDKSSIDYLVRLKTNLEDIEEWDENQKGTYLSTIRLLSDFASRHNFYDFQETILHDALNAYQIRDSINNRYYRDILVSLTALYINKKDFYHAIRTGKNAIALYQTAKDLGVEYIALMHNLSSGAIAINDYISALSFVEEGFRVISAIDSQHSSSMDLLQCHLWNDRGRIAFRQGDNSLAESFFTECIEKASNNGITSVLKLARNNLAVLYIKQNKYEQALAILNDINADCPNCESLLNSLHLRYRISSESNDSLVNKNLKRYNDLRYSQSVHLINSSGEIERTAFLEAITKEMIWNNNLIASRFPCTTKEAFDANLFGRNISIGVNIALRCITKPHNAYSERLIELRRLLLSKKTTREQQDSIHEEISDLEKYLLSRSDIALEKEVECVGSWDVIRESISENDAVLLFCYIPTIDNTGSDYGVYVGTKEMDSPVLVDLCNADDIENLVLAQSNDPISISEFYNHDISRVVNMIWDKIFPLIEGKNRIYYTPTGVLSLMNIENVKLNSGIVLNESHNMIMCSSPARIRDLSENAISIDEICLFGAPNYNLEINEMVELSAKHLQFSGSGINDDLQSIDAAIRSGWGELPGTVREINVLSSLAAEADIKAVAFIANDATEEHFKELSGSSPRIIHVASHGFAYSQSRTNEIQNVNSKEIDSLSDGYNILQLSGLVLTGGNNIWTGKIIPDKVEDGILTAEEISRLDLSNTELVVLSACDTALGLIDPVDGVWGLQRAFKQAGVRSILMTLWKIPDNTTTMFMKEFYSQLLSGKTKRQALKNAQNYLKENGASDPYYWAPFVILD